MQGRGLSGWDTGKWGRGQLFSSPPPPFPRTWKCLSLTESCLIKPIGCAWGEGKLGGRLIVTKNISPTSWEEEAAAGPACKVGGHRRAGGAPGPGASWVMGVRTQGIGRRGAGAAVVVCLTRVSSGPVDLECGGRGQWWRDVGVAGATARVSRC